MNNIFKGTGPAVITPFKKSDLSIDFDALTRVLNFQIESGVDFIVALGTTAETVTMSHDERHLVYQHIKGINKAKLPLMVGFGGNNTAEVIRHIKSADFNGIDGILSVVPYYNKPSQEGVYRHFMAIAEVCPVPVILYNVPSRCGINMSAETTIRLANSSDKFMAIKEASGNIDQINKIIAEAPAGFGVISGDDSLIYDVCNNGGEGVISVMANALPAETVELTNLSLKKDANAKALQLKYAELIRLLFVEGNPCGVKSILGKKGLIDNVLRLPMCPVSEETSMKISEELSKLFKMAIDFSKIPSPCFVIDEHLLEKNLQLIASVKEKAGVEIILALKGFAMWSMFPLIRKYVGSTTASSLSEARLAIEEFGTPAHTYAPAYTDDDFPGILDCSSHITFNSLSQYSRFYPMIKESGKNVSLGLRVNPEYSEVQTDLYNPCAPGSRLGVVADQLPYELPEGIEGLHFHTLCESKSFDLEKTLKAFENKFSKYFPQIKWVNMGGGHLMTHKDYDPGHLIEILKDFRNRTGLNVILEPGSAFAWETGCLLSTVIDVVENKGIKTAILDVSFAAHMPDCLEMPYKPKIVGSYFEPIKEKPTYRMGGNSCLSGDFVGDWSFDNELKPGDKIIFEDMIHYTMVKTTFFNGVTHPSIGSWNDNTGFRLIRKFGYNDFKGKLS